MLTLLCEDSIDGVFSGIYEVWAGGHDRDQIVLKTGDIGNYELFMEYREVPVNAEHVQKVGMTIRKRFGEETYESVCYALWSKEEDKADAVYRMIRYGIEHRCGYELQHHLTNPAVERVFELQRSTYCEAHHYLGFLRFARLESGILYAAAEAKNDILEAVAPHFADRLPSEDWIIHDKGYKKAVVHPACREWFVVEERHIARILEQKYAGGEEDIRQLWRNFCSSVSIQSRENLALQRQNLPLRFRRNMV